MVGAILLPLSICLIPMIVGILFVWLSRKQKIGKILLTVGIVMLTFFSYGAFADVFLYSLEAKYPPLKDLKAFSDVKWVVVLGGGHISNPALPYTGQISNTTLARLAEGIRIYHELPNSKLLVSGGAFFDPVPEADIMAGVAFSLGINKKDVLLEAVSKDTKDQAWQLEKILGNSRFILVTSASHMMRSAALFRKRGMHPIPAPTDYWATKRQGFSPDRLIPNAEGLRKLERVFHEYLGVAWAKLRGQI